MIRQLHYICKSLVTMLLSQVISPLLLLVMGIFVVLFCSIVSCTDDLDLNDNPQTITFEPGLTSGQTLAIVLNLDSLTSKENQTRIFDNANIDTVMILLSNKNTTIYNPNNHISKYIRTASSSSSWKFRIPMFLGDISAFVGAYAPDTASLVSPVSDSIWMYVEHDFKHAVADTLQVDYLYGEAKNLTENPDGTPSQMMIDEADSANFMNPIVGMTMQHALAKLRIHICNLAYKDTAKYSGVKYTTYTGAGDVNHVYFCGKNFITKSYMSVVDKTARTSVPSSGVTSVDTLHWGPFNTSSVENPQNVSDQVTDTRGDTALYTALVSPGRYNKPYVGIVLDGVGRYVCIKDGNVTLVKGREYDVYVTVCNSTASKLVILGVYVVDWMDSRMPTSMNMSNLLNYFTDLVPINWDSAHNKMSWVNDTIIAANGDTILKYMYSSRQPFMYDESSKLIYAYSDCVSPGHVHTGAARLQWAYPANSYTFSDGVIVKRIVSEDKIYIYDASKVKLPRPACVLYNTIMRDPSGVLVYDYDSTMDIFTWAYPSDVYITPDGTKIIHEFKASEGKHYVYFYDSSGLYYEINY